MVAPADSKKTGAGTAAPALPPELRELLGIVAFVLVMLAFIAAVFGIGYVGSHLSVLTERHCWQLQSAGGKTYKINTCTGKMQPVDGKPKDD